MKKCPSTSGAPVRHFRELCHRHGLAATHQREIIYRTVMNLAGHPSPEAIYAQVRMEIPSISLATVYNNLRTFLGSGMLREVSLHHGSLRVEANGRPHHHLVCIRCRKIEDLDEKAVEPARIVGPLPRGFKAERLTTDILGTCADCAKESGRMKPKL